MEAYQGVVYSRNSLLSLQILQFYLVASSMLKAVFGLQLLLGLGFSLSHLNRTP